MKNNSKNLDSMKATNLVELFLNEELKTIQTLTLNRIQFKMVTYYNIFILKY